jgi:hypothetical protein
MLISTYVKVFLVIIFPLFKASYKNRDPAMFGDSFSSVTVPEIGGWKRFQLGMHRISGRIIRLVLS